MQIAITKSVWSELFAVGLVQCQNLLSLSSVVSALLIHLQSNCTSTRLTNIADHVSRLQYFIKTANFYNLDDYEFAGLKALILFSPGEFPLSLLICILSELCDNNDLIHCREVLTIWIWGG